MSWAARVATTGVSAGVAWAAWRARARVPGGERRWRRTNHRGEPVTLLEGPAWTVGALTGLALATGLVPKQRLAVLVAVAGSAVFGAVDDLNESGSSKGLRGHLGALARGQVTTGALKIVGIGASGLVAAALLVPNRRGAVRLADLAISGGLIAGAANLANLLDLRPGRLLKVVLLATPAVASGPAGLCQAAGTGAALALLPADLAEQAMLGDCGANAAGALLGSAVVLATLPSASGTAWRSGVFATIVGLTLISERVSFTTVIESTPVLREIDGWGRRPRAGQAPA